MEEILKETFTIAMTAAIPTAVIICWLTGWAIKEYKWFNTKHIPVTMMIIGTAVVFFVNGMAFSVEKVLLPGMVSGAISVWGYDLLMGYVKAHNKKDSLSDEWKEGK